VQPSRSPPSRHRRDARVVAPLASPLRAGTLTPRSQTGPARTERDRHSRRAVTWETIDDLIASRWNGRLELRGKGCAAYLIPSPTGTIHPGLHRFEPAVVRDRPRLLPYHLPGCERSKAWFQTYTWPLVASTCKQGRMNGFPAEQRGS